MKPAGPAASFRDVLLAWYSRQARDLPWRRTRDPYAILVSEVMLQQTQVERVAPKFVEFLGRFPTIDSLATAPVAEVIRAWAPLGYNLRAVRLHALARRVVEKHGGQLPCAAAELRCLPGIGPYTAAAVACFAFGEQIATVDTNVARVLARVSLGAVDAGGVRAQCEALAAGSLPRASAAAWNQALMDLGATICSARAPACGRCPVARQCLARPRFADRNGLPRAAEARARYRAAAPPFKTSRRYFRGRIVQALREAQAGSGLSAGELGRTVKPSFSPDDLPWVEQLLLQLQGDGLVQLERHGAELWAQLPG